MQLQKQLNRKKKRKTCEADDDELDVELDQKYELDTDEQVHSKKTFFYTYL